MKKQPIRTLSSVWPARPSLHPALKSISARMYRVASSAPCARDCLHAASKSHSAFTHSTSIRSHIVPASWKSFVSGYVVSERGSEWRGYVDGAGGPQRINVTSPMPSDSTSTY